MTKVLQLHHNPLKQRDAILSVCSRIRKRTVSVTKSCSFCSFSKEFMIFFIIDFVHTCVSVWEHEHMSAVIHRSLKVVSVPLELELQGSVSCLVWVLRYKHRSSVRTDSAFRCRVVSPAPIRDFLNR